MEEKTTKPLSDHNSKNQSIRTKLGWMLAGIALSAAFNLVQAYLSKNYIEKPINPTHGKLSERRCMAITDIRQALFLFQGRWLEIQSHREQSIKWQGPLTTDNKNTLRELATQAAEVIAAHVGEITESDYSLAIEYFEKLLKETEVFKVANPPPHPIRPDISDNRVDYTTTDYAIELQMICRNDLGISN